MEVNSARKEAAISFMKLVASGKVHEAYERYVAVNFRHHNVYFPGDARSLQRGMEENAKMFPQKNFEVQRTIAEGNTVAVHSRMQLKPQGEVMALVHIFRFEGDRIAELWDVGQQIPEQMPNENGPF